jgi:Domain of unknown function (DUF3883)
MGEGQKHGTVWQEDELDAIVADYFDMLRAELDGTPYVKSRHNSALMARIGRTHRSVEFKHQNISAVLDKLGHPWIAGYKPKENYQNSIFDAIDRYLSSNHSVLELARPARMQPEDPSSVFEAPPLAPQTTRLIPPKLKRLVRKFDPALRDSRNRELGRAGEAFVVRIERRRLAEAGRMDLARKLRWVSFEDGDGAGYDILSFEPDGRESLLEVKTTNGGGRTPFFLTCSELEMADERPGEWRIYRVHSFATGARIFTISPPLQSSLVLTADSWRASPNPDWSPQ